MRESAFAEFQLIRVDLCDSLAFMVAVEVRNPSLTPAKPFPG